MKQLLEVALMLCVTGCASVGAQTVNLKPKKPAEKPREPAYEIGSCIIRLSTGGELNLCSGMNTIPPTTILPDPMPTILRTIRAAKRDSVNR